VGFSVIIYFLGCAFTDYDTILTHYLNENSPGTGWTQDLWVALSHMSCLGGILSILALLQKRAEHGSFRSASKADKAEFKKINKRIDLGKVQQISVEQGGFLGNTMSTIETDKGIYRVFGDVGSVAKGELVSKRQNELFLGLAKGKSYTIKG
jgi:hypothetical protein